MKIFPTKILNFQLVGNQEETLERLNRRTEKSDRLVSISTDKSFVGKVEKNKFRLISSKIENGAFCVMSGIIDEEKGQVKVEIHKVFRFFMSIFLLFPIIGFLILLITKQEEFSLIMVLVVIGQILIIRYAFIELAFKLISQRSLNRLRDVLDIEWIK